MKTIDRFFLFLDEKGVNYANVEKFLGISNGYLGKMRGRQASIGSDIIEKIVHKYPELNPAWLISGEGNMLRKKNLENESVDEQNLNFTIKLRKLYNSRRKHYRKINHICLICQEKDKRIEDLKNHIQKLELIINEYLISQKEKL
jgi:hypothetical protein